MGPLRPMLVSVQGMTTTLPPTTEIRRLRLELRLAPHRMRDDALQEAWVAFLSGRDPARAVNTYARRERRRRMRWLPLQIADGMGRNKEGRRSGQAGGKPVRRRSPAPLQLSERPGRGQRNFGGME